MVIMSSMLLLHGVAQAQSGVNGSGYGDEYRTITTAVPFLNISPDARCGGMGDVGLALKPDASSEFWNIGKMAMCDKEFGANIAYTPWLRDIVNDVFLANLSAYYKFGEADNKNQAITFSLRYFSLGEINYADINAASIGTGLPREYAFGVGYSRKLSEKVSVGLSGKYINSTLVTGPAAQGTNNKPGNGFAVDFGGYYTTPIGEPIADGVYSKLNIGAAVRNLGTKISYSTDRKDFLPTNLGIGAAYDYAIDEYSRFTFALDLNKLLVPSPQYVLDSNENLVPKPYENTPVLTGVFSSFGDAYGGGGEELKEIMVSTGAEYAYQEQFFARAGYFYEAKLKGDRRYFTLGLGVKYNIFGLDFAYVVPSGSGVNRNPLSNTLRFTLKFDINNFSEIVKGKPKEDDSKDSRKAKDE